MIKFVLPLIISLCFILESVFVELFPESMFDHMMMIIPRFLIVVILFTTVYVSLKIGLVYGFVFGLLFDIVYIEVIGIYLFLIPLIVYLISLIMKVLQTNIILVSIVSLLGVALLEHGAFGMNLIINRTNMDYLSFLDFRLVPTLILNGIFIIIVSFPLKKYLEHYAEVLKND
jgi:rod shape-determining protein MreD